MFYNLQVTLIPLFLFFNSIIAQNIFIDSAAITGWHYLETNHSVVSNNGKYITYRIQNMPRSKHTMVIKKTDNSWMLEVPTASFLYVHR